MREIKFRAWDGYKMFEVNVISFDSDTAYNGYDFYSGDSNERCSFGGNEKGILMQYTGLKDKNGKEIYEGDIMEITTNFHTELVTVIWDKDYWTFKDDGTYGTLSEWNETSLVVGNTYDNPELLN